MICPPCNHDCKQGRTCPARGKKMKATIKDRIVAHRSAPDVYDPPSFEQMADHIEELEERLKAAENDAKEAETYAGELEAKLAKAVEALGEAIYLLDPGEEDIAKGAGLYRIVTTYAELTSSEAANGEAKGGKDE